MADLEADIAIVGAGPAGASAAIRLARAGRRVVLIDRKHFPRQKVCGGCLSGPAVARLRELLDEGQPLPGVAATCITFVIGNYRLTCRSDGRTQVVHRAELDAVLVEAATKAGADGWFGEPATIELADPGRNRFSVRVGNRRLEAGTVLIATGVAGLAGKLVGGRAAQPGMLAQQWVQPAGPGLPEPGAVELHWLRGGYVGLASPQAGECVVALAARVVQDAGESACDRLRRLNPGARLWNLLLPDAPRRYGARGTAGFPWRPRR
ncbi:MAG: FAD-dependent oxidoreductase, partial [Phycisphaerae bacterium]